MIKLVFIISAILSTIYIVQDLLKLIKKVVSYFFHK